MSCYMQDDLYKRSQAKCPKTPRRGGVEEAVVRVRRREDAPCHTNSRLHSAAVGLSRLLSASRPINRPFWTLMADLAPHRWTHCGIDVPVCGRLGSTSRIPHLEPSGTFSYCSQLIWASNLTSPFLSSLPWLEREHEMRCVAAETQP